MNAQGDNKGTQVEKEEVFNLPPLGIALTFIIRLPVFFSIAYHGLILAGLLTIDDYPQEALMTCTHLRLGILVLACMLADSLMQNILNLAIK